VWKTDGFQESVSVRELIHECGKRSGRQYKLVMLGDALMAPYELMGFAGIAEDDRITGLEWLMMLREQFDRSVWLNPEHPSGWKGNTIEVIAKVFPMYPLTVEGLGMAVDELIKGRSRR
jgi:uncharacterized protein with von Willebrand factor type A (vWA) domain